MVEIDRTDINSSISDVIGRLFRGMPIIVGRAVVRSI